MTSHLDSHMSTDVKPDILSGVHTGNGIPQDRYNIRGIATYAQTEKTTRAKLYMYIVVGQGTCQKSSPYTDQAYKTLVVLVMANLILFQLEPTTTALSALPSYHGA